MLRPDEVAQMLNVSRWTIYRWVKDGRLQASKLGHNSLRIFRSSVEDLITLRKLG